QAIGQQGVSPLANCDLRGYFPAMKFVEALAMGCVVTSISMVRTSPFAASTERSSQNASAPTCLTTKSSWHQVDLPGCNIVDAARGADCLGGECFRQNRRVPVHPLHVELDVLLDCGGSPSLCRRSLY